MTSVRLRPALGVNSSQLHVEYEEVETYDLEVQVALELGSGSI